MSLATVKDRLTRIVEQTPPTTRVRGLPASFKRISTPSDPLDGRRFFFRLSALSVLGPHIQVDGGFVRMVDDMDVVLCYPEDLGGDEVDDHIHADYVVVTRRLLDQTTWRPEKSGIVSISAATVDRILPSTLEREPGIIRLVIPLTVEHTI